jgi:hypothetical protein
VAGDDGSATIWPAPPDVDLDGDGRLDAVAPDFDRNADAANEL